MRKPHTHLSNAANAASRVSSSRGLGSPKLFWVLIQHLGWCIFVYFYLSQYMSIDQQIQPSDMILELDYKCNILLNWHFHSIRFTWCSLCHSWRWFMILLFFGLRACSRTFVALETVCSVYVFVFIIFCFAVSPVVGNSHLIVLRGRIYDDAIIVGNIPIRNKCRGVLNSFGYNFPIAITMLWAIYRIIFSYTGKKDQTWCAFKIFKYKSS